MNTTHATAFYEAMSNRDSAGIMPHLADQVVMLSPILPEPVVGKEAVVRTIAGLLATIDSYTVDVRVAADRDEAAFFTIACAEVTVQGNEYMHLDAQGLIDHISVAWRPLTSGVLLQAKLAGKFGMQPLRLVPA